MKKLMGLWILLLTMVLLAVPALADTAGGVIICPAEAERQIAPGRDFYVIARVDDEYAEQVRAVTVRLLDEGGRVMREVTSGAEDYATDHPELNAFNTAADEWLMPDLLYDAGDPDSLSYAWNKCYYHDGYAVALISGGEYDSFIAPVNADGSAFAPLTGGDYELRVEFTLADGSRLAPGQTLRLQSTDDKVLARFSPEAHLAQVTAAAERSALRMYLDPLPGYWSPADIFAGAEDNPYFAELKEKWQGANARELAAGQVHFYLYNVSASCATQAVEIATLQRDGTLNERMRIYHYDLGEPYLRYLNPDGSPVDLSGEFVPLAEGDTLQLTRAESAKDAPARDNFYNCWAPAVKQVDGDVYDGIIAGVGETITLFGVAAPIPNAAEDITALSRSSWQVGNLASTVHYRFTRDGQEVLTESKAIALERELEAGWNAASIYEFAHAFTLTPELAGHLQIELYATDTHGRAVPGSAETLTLEVTVDSDRGTTADDAPISGAPNHGGGYDPPARADTPRFTDVSPADWFYDSVQTIAAAELLRGTSATTFAPQTAMTRAMFVTVLWRLVGEPSADAHTNFTDVAAGAWYAEAAAWAARNEIVNGTGDGAFSPDTAVTREQMATIIYRCTQGAEAVLPWFEGNGSPAVNFTDAADISAWAADGVAWCAAQNLFAGYADGSFKPQDTITRAEVAAVLARII